MWQATTLQAQNLSLILIVRDKERRFIHLQGALK